MNTRIIIGKNDIKDFVELRKIQKIVYKQCIPSYGFIDVMSCPVGGMFYNLQELYGRDRKINGQEILYIEEIQIVGLMTPINCPGHYDIIDSYQVRWYEFDITDEIIIDASYDHSGILNSEGTFCFRNNFNDNNIISPFRS